MGIDHVFQGEQLTQKNIRHCVNGLSLDFVENESVTDTEEAIFAAGCFWGVEYFFKQLPGVIKTEVGYSGGRKDKPSYQKVCHDKIGHFEVIRVVYDPHKISYEQVCQYFFEIHDFTQKDGQGPDIGEQYQSRIFYYDQLQKEVALKLIQSLEKHHHVATKILPVKTFWAAEKNHQDYYAKANKAPYCHHHKKLIFS